MNHVYALQTSERYFSRRSDVSSFFNAKFHVSKLRHSPRTSVLSFYPPCRNQNFDHSNLEMVQDRIKSVLSTNGKLHMSFQLVQKSVTLNDLERRRPNMAVVINLLYYTECVAFIS